MGFYIRYGARTEEMVAVFHNSATLILIRHMTPLRNAKKSEEYPHKIREAKSIVNIEDTGQLTFASKKKRKKMSLSLFPFLMGTSPLFLHSC